MTTVSTLSRFPRQIFPVLTRSPSTRGTRSPTFQPLPHLVSRWATRSPTSCAWHGQWSRRSCPLCGDADGSDSSSRASHRRPSRQHSSRHDHRHHETFRLTRKRRPPVEETSRRPARGGPRWSCGAAASAGRSDSSGSRRQRSVREMLTTELEVSSRRGVPARGADRAERLWAVYALDRPDLHEERGRR